MGASKRDRRKHTYPGLYLEAVAQAIRQVSRLEDRPTCRTFPALHRASGICGVRPLSRLRVSVGLAPNFPFHVQRWTT